MSVAPTRTPCIEQAPARQPASADAEGEGPQLLVLSAKSRKALEDSSRRLADFLDSEWGCGQLSDVASTLFDGRTHFAHRRVVAASRSGAGCLGLARDRSELRRRAHFCRESFRRGLPFPWRRRPVSRDGAITLSPRDILPQRPSMRALASCPLTSRRRFAPFGSATRRPTQAQRFLNPALQLPAILITEIAIARLWMSWGIKPGALIGHSMGEIRRCVHCRCLEFQELPLNSCICAADCSTRSRRAEC